jgi:hypothetical protein
MMPNRLGETSVHQIWKISRKLLQGGGFSASILYNLGTNQRRLVKAKAFDSGYLNITYYVLFLFHLGLIWRQNLQHSLKFIQEHPGNKSCLGLHKEGTPKTVEM